MITEVIVASVAFAAIYYTTRFLTKPRPRPGYLTQSSWVMTPLTVLCMLTFAVTCTPSTAGVAALSFAFGALLSWNQGLASTFKDSLAQIEEYANWQYTRNSKSPREPGDLV